VKFHHSVVEVSDEEFKDCTQLREVILNEGLKKIGKQAFQNCTFLESIVFPSSVTVIGMEAFEGCIKLREIVLNNGLQEILFKVFGGCKVESITLPSSVTYALGAFSGCSKLKYVVLTEGIDKIWPVMFQDCKSLSSIALPSTTRVVCTGAFGGCSQLKEVILPEGLQRIEQSAFKECTSLVNIKVPPTVTEIGSRAFWSCSSLLEVFLHEHIRNIDMDVFYNCRSLETLRFPAISSRLRAIIQGGHWIEIDSEVDAIRGALERSNGELYVLARVMEHEIAMERGKKWVSIREAIRKIDRLISYYEMKEAASIFELALWKAKLNQAGGNIADRSECRIAMPGPVMDTIWEYFYSPSNEDQDDSRSMLKDWSQLGLFNFPDIQEGHEFFPIW
jgi:hypothetical protein